MRLPGIAQSPTQPEIMTIARLETEWLSPDSAASAAGLAFFRLKNPTIGRSPR
jgi:hypothetical protein